VSRAAFRCSSRTLAIASVFVVAACSTDRLPTGPGINPVGAASVAQTNKAFSPQDTVLRYIVRLKAPGGSVSATASALVQPFGGKLSHVFEHVFPGFVTEGISRAASAIIAKNPLVDYVEEEGFSYPTDVQSLVYGSQWGLDWIDQRTPPVDWQYSYTYTGAGVHVYIVDSGVRGGHVEFTGRMGNGTCKVSYSSGCSPTIDQIGHGTSVASQAAGTTAGVAKQATIHPVRIDDGGGGARDGDIIAGLDWVLGNRISPAVVNLSYGDDGSCGCGGSFAQRDALQRLVDNGITVVKSAGNANRDAYMWRPNRVTPALVVAAAGWDGYSTLYRMSYSSYGSTVDLYAPGNGTLAATNTANDAYRHDFGGTSGASPFVAGVAAQILQANPFYGSGQVETTVRAIATAGVISGTMPGDTNLFLFRY
jgi:subtilisin family serine protease